MQVKYETIKSESMGMPRPYRTPIFELTLENLLSMFYPYS
jgi:hypothetical protein